MAAGAIVGFATWSRWVALDTAAVGVVLALGLLAVPIVLVMSPVVGGVPTDRADARVIAGAALVIAGALVIAAAE